MNEFILVLGAILRISKIILIKKWFCKDTKRWAISYVMESNIGWNNFFDSEKDRDDVFERICEILNNETS